MTDLYIMSHTSVHKIPIHNCFDPIVSKSERGKENLMYLELIWELSLCVIYETKTCLFENILDVKYRKHAVNLQGM